MLHMQSVHYNRMHVACINGSLRRIPTSIGMESCVCTKEFNTKVTEQFYEAIIYSLDSNPIDKLYIAAWYALCESHMRLFMSVLARVLATETIRRAYTALQRSQLNGYEFETLAALKQKIHAVSLFGALHACTCVREPQVRCFVAV